MLSSFASPIVGILAQRVFGYKPIPEGSTDLQQIDVNKENATSVAKALYVAIAIPTAMCCFAYYFLYCTYPRDRDQAKINALVESEMDEIERDNYFDENDEKSLLAIPTG